MAFSPQEEQDSTMGWLLGKTFFIITGVFILGFAVQTGLLVSHLLPQDDLLIQVLTVFSFDGMALLYYLAINFYKYKSGRTKFRDPASLHAIYVMFYVSLTGSFLCTLAWMMLDSNHFNWQSVPGWLVMVVNILVTVAFGVHVIIAYYVGSKEHNAKYLQQVVRTTQPAPEWRTPEPEIMQPVETVQMAQNTGPIQRIPAHTEKHPKNCYCTSCRPR